MMEHQNKKRLPMVLLAISTEAGRMSSKVSDSRFDPGPGAACRARVAASPLPSAEP